MDSAQTAAALLVLVVVASCAVSGFELVGATAAAGGGGAGSTGTGAGGAGGQAGASGCTHVSYPEPPAASDGGPDDVELVVAVRKIDFGEKDLGDGAKVGFDLDRLCSCQGDGFPCKDEPYANADHCDGPGGIDNAAAHIFQAAALLGDDLGSEHDSQRANDGEWSLLLRVHDYNGKDNDDQVTVALYPSPGFALDPCNSPGSKPAWTGSDRWPVAASSVHMAGGGGGGGGGGAKGCEEQGAPGYDVEQPRYLDVNAYVSGKVLVANLPAVEMILAGASGGARVKLEGGVVSGTLAQKAAGWYLEGGILAGRWNVDGMFKTLSTLVAGGTPLCVGDDLYNLVKTAVCSYPDITSKIAGPTASCDAISLGMKFDAEPAQVGVVRIVSDTPSSCPPDKDPKNDSCGS